jgi:2-iminobutanoate/2-iminopropanoate deaminase
MKKIDTAEAPAAIGPYSQAVFVEPFLFVSGQIPLDPQTKKLVDSDIRLQTQQVLKNLEAVLAAAGMSFENVVKTSIFLKDLNDFSIVNEEYGKAFSHPIKPARETVQVVRLPMDSLIEISCIAYLT